MRFSSRQRAVLLLVLATVLLCLPILLSARGTDRPKAVIVADAAYILDTPVQIVAGQVIEYSVSPDGRYVLVTSGSPATADWRESLTQQPLSVPKRHILTLSLYEARTGRTQTLRTWNDETKSRRLSRGEWLADNDTALLTMVNPTSDDSPLSDADLLLVHCARQSVQTVPQPSRESPAADVFTLASPTRPETIVSVYDEGSEKTTLRLMSSRGVFGAVVSAGAGDFYPVGWNKSGDVVLLSRFVGKTEQVKAHFEHALWNRTTGETTPLKSRPSYKDYDFGVAEYAPPAAPLRLVTERGSVSTASGAKANVPTTVAVGADGKEREIVAVDAEAATVVGKPTSPVLIYRQHDALYAVPVRMVTKAAFDECLRKEAVSSVKQISLSLMMYSQDYDEQLPLASHDVANDISPYLKSEDTFLDARTGANAFTYTYTGVADAAGRKPLFTFKTTTGIYRAFWMPDGNVVTEPPLATPKP